MTKEEVLEYVKIMKVCAETPLAEMVCDEVIKIIEKQIPIKSEEDNCLSCDSSPANFEGEYCSHCGQRIEQKILN